LLLALTIVHLALANQLSRWIGHDGMFLCVGINKANNGHEITVYVIQEDNFCGAEVTIQEARQFGGDLLRFKGFRAKM
jgi:hypothetical protein